MVGKRVQFDDETWEAIVALAHRNGSSFEQLTEEAYAGLLKKHKQPVGLKASLKEKREQATETQQEPKETKTIVAFRAGANRAVLILVRWH